MNLEIFSIVEGEQPSIQQFELSSKGCVRVDTGSSSRLSFVLREQLAVNSMVSDVSKVKKIELVNCAGYCQAFPICGEIRDVLQNKVNRGGVLRIGNSVGSTLISVTEKNQTRPLIANEKGCFRLPTGETLNVVDSIGNFIEVKLEDLSRHGVGELVVINLREQLSEDEKTCRLSPNKFILRGKKCYAKNFLEICKDFPQNPGVLMLSRYFMRHDCNAIFSYLNSRSKIEFNAKRLTNPEIFSALPNLRELELSGNSFTSVENLIGSDLVALNLNDGKVDFDVASLNSFQSLRKLSLVGTHLVNLQNLSRFDTIEELKVSTSDQKLLRSFPNLKNLEMQGDIDLSSVLNPAKITRLVLRISDEPRNIEMLSRFKNLEDLEISSLKLPEDFSLPKFLRLKKLSIINSEFPDLRELESSSTLVDLQIAIDLDYQSESAESGMPVLKSVKVLDLLGDKADNLSILKKFPNVEILNLGGDISVSEAPRAESVREIVGKYVEPESYSILENFPNVRRVFLGSATGGVSDKDFPPLEFLEEFEGAVVNLEEGDNLLWLSKIPRIKKLHLSVIGRNKEIKLSLAKTFEDLYLKSEMVKSVEFSDLLPNLNTLTVYSLPKMSDARLIMPKLNDFSFVDAKVVDYLALPVFSSVEKVSISFDDSMSTEQQITDLGKENKFPNAVKLGVSHSEKNVFLKYFPKLTELDLGNTLPSFVGFPILKHLKTLHLSGSFLSLNGIENFPNVETLTFHVPNQITDFSPLSKLPNLRLIDGARDQRQRISQAGCPETGDLIPKGLKDYCRDTSLSMIPQNGPERF